LGLTQWFNTDSGFEFNTLFNTYATVVNQSIWMVTTQGLILRAPRRVERCCSGCAVSWLLRLFSVCEHWPEKTSHALAERSQPTMAAESGQRSLYMYLTIELYSIPIFKKNCSSTKTEVYIGVIFSLRTPSSGV
jgi:hypothetical protein